MQHPISLAADGRGEIQTPRYRLRYSAHGNGPPLVIIHGMNDVPESFLPLVNQLKPHYKCILYHLPEGVPDGANLHKYHHSNYVDDLICLIDSLQHEKVHLLGSSFGSTVTLRAVATHPERFHKAIIQGGFACRPFNPAERFLAVLGRSWPWRMGQLPIRHRIMRHLEKPAFQGNPAALEDLIRHSGESTVRSVTQRARILERLDLRPLLPSITTPLLMIGGDRDAIVPRRCEAEVEAGVPHAKRIEFANCGHYPQYTHPVQMANCIVEYLQDRL
ncbi:hypothetical protein BH11PLA2_BH11PLA2_32270 [soil metagenome]